MFKMQFLPPVPRGIFPQRPRTPGECFPPAHQGACCARDRLPRISFLVSIEALFLVIIKFCPLSGD